MGDEDHRHTLPLQFLDAADQRLFGIAVQVRIGLVQHHKLGRAVQRAGQPDQLALAARQMLPAIADLGVIALRQAQDHLMAAGQPRGLEGQLRIWVGHAGDVPQHGAVEQLHILRQVADMAAEILPQPGEHIGAIQPHRAGGRLQGADQQADQRGLARRRGADDGQRFAGREVEGHALDDRDRLAGEAEGHAFRRDPPGWLGQRHARRAQPRQRQEGEQPAIALPRLHQLLPATDHLLHRRQRTPHDDGGGDGGAGRDLLFQHQQRAHAEHRDLHGQPQEARHRQHQRRAIRRAVLLGEGGGEAFAPALQDRRPHAHAVDHLRIAHDALGPALAGHGAG